MVNSAKVTWKEYAISAEQGQMYDNGGKKFIHAYSTRIFISRGKFVHEILRVFNREKFWP